MFDLSGKVAVDDRLRHRAWPGHGVGPGAGGLRHRRRQHRAGRAKRRRQCIGWGGGSTTSRADLGIAAADEVIARATAAFGRIDILVNNAGIIRRADALEFTEKDWDEVIAVNLKAVFFLSQAAARQFIRAEDGRGGSSTSPRCCRSRAAFGCPPTPRRKAAWPG